MERKRNSLVHLACASLIAGAVGAAYASPGTGSAAVNDQSSVSRQEAKNYQGARASHLIGTRVTDKNGKALGKIDDLVVHMSTGDVRYAILAQRTSDGNERLYAVPLGRLSGREGGRFSIDVAENEIGGKWWRKDKWPGLQDSAFWGEIDRLSGLPAVQPTDRYYAHRVSDLIGKDVTTPTGEDLGSVRDLVINVNDESVHYAILDFQAAGVAGDRRFAVPMTAFMFPRSAQTRELQTDTLMLNVDPSAVRQMHSFSDNAWPDFTDPSRVAQIDRYLIAIFPVATIGGQTASGTTSGASPSRSAGGMSAGGTPGEVFDRFDLNNDGVLDRSEYSRFKQSQYAAQR